MKCTHEEIKEIMPEYINGLTSGEAISELKEHLKECVDCGRELSLIRELLEYESPDPGENYWKTLPAKVSSLVTSKEKKMFSLKPFFRPVPAFISIAMLALAVVSYVYIIGVTDIEPDPFFEEPLASSLLDINGIAEDDIPAALGEWRDVSVIEGEIEEDFGLYSYHMEIAYLNSYENESLFKELNNKGKKEEL